MRRNICLIILALSLLSVNTSSQIKPNDIVGSWMGRLNAGAITLRIIFNISIAGPDSLVATMDSPDQGAKNIKMGVVSFADGNLKIAAPMILGEYNGTFENDTLITGTWKQGGQSIPLDLTRLKVAFSLKRPQEPLPPFPYSAEEVSFHNDKAGIDLAGTLTLPRGNGPFKAVILISGSGAQNRDEELLGHKPFLVIADRLTRSGIAVLRYDDRGVGKSGGNPLTSTSADFATDAAAAFRFLSKDPRINPDLIGIIGHSEGGFIAPMVAAENNVSFIVSLAGTGVTGEKVILKQSADISSASGINEKEIESSIKTNKKLFAILREEKDNVKASEKMASAYEKMLSKEDLSTDDKDKALQQVKAGLQPQTLTWLRYFISTDPAEYWKKVKCPVLALNGEKDLQVDADMNLRAIEKALKAGGNRSVRTVKLPELNHLFQQSKTGLPAEYGEIEETISEEVLQIISNWINALPVR